MKQILQNLSNGDTLLTEIPVPCPGHGQVLIRSERSLVSVGTERMLVAFGRANLLDKARQQPSRVVEVLAKIKSDGLQTTIEAVQSKLDRPIALGYSNAGIVVELGSGVRSYRPGDRVISNGPHSEYVAVPENLCAPIPDGVTFDEAAFTVVASIALQGIRLANPTFGETFVVTGLGLIGLITTQLLVAHGCNVIGIDLSSDKCRRAVEFGAVAVDLGVGDDPVATAKSLTHDMGVDGVIITASSKSAEPVHQAALMCRKRGRIVLVGVVGLELSREDFYEKELSFQVSCSYGPGRYDESYEVQGVDYPFGFVRWTAQRNFQAILSSIANRRLNLASLITHRFPFAKATDAYGEGIKDALGLLLDYQTDTPAVLKRTVVLPTSLASPIVPEVSVGVIGAGGFTSLVILPALKEIKLRLRTIASSKGVTSTHLGRKFGFERSTTNLDDVFDDPETNTIFITTRHDSHAKFVERALRSGKNVFVEKPLAITRDELASIKETYERQAAAFVMVGFNRRFSPLTIKMRQLLDTIIGPKSVIVTVNSGYIPKDHWTQDSVAGGGRVIGEACHFVDLIRFLMGHPILKVVATSAKSKNGAPVDDEVTITLSFSDGSMGTVHYLSSGHKSLSKERVEVFADGKVLQLDNFRSLAGFGWSGFRPVRLSKQDKGHKLEIATVIDAIKQGAPAPIPWDEIVEVTEVLLDAAEQIRAG